jgi:hypothetical protein
VLEQCAKVKGFRKVLSRTDMLGKVKQYDAKLTDALQVFQVRFKLVFSRTIGLILSQARVVLGGRLTQIVQERRVRRQHTRIVNISGNLNHSLTQLNSFGGPVALSRAASSHLTE